MDDDLIMAVGNRGRGKGEFTNPQGVAVTITGDILVADSNTQCVQVRFQVELRLKAAIRLF